MTRSIAIIPLLFVLACNSEKESESPNLGRDSSVPVFELREFKIDATNSSEYSVTFKGRGTVVVKNPELQNANVLLWLKETEHSKPPETTDRVVVASNGIGILETWKYVSKEKGSEVSVPEYSWKCVGYVRLSDAEFKTDK